MVITSEALQDLTGARSIRAIALAIGMEPSTLARQVKGGLPAETVITIARNYQLSPVKALLRFGFITEGELVRAAIEYSLAAASDEELAEEILERVRGNRAGTSLTEPITDVSGTKEDATVTQFPARDDLTAEEAEEILRTHRYAADNRDGRDDEQEADPLP